MHLSEQAPNWIYLNRNNSSATCSISLELGRNFDHVTTNTLQCKESEVKATV